jgi:hypothetical protein
MYNHGIGRPAREPGLELDSEYAVCPLCHAALLAILDHATRRASWNGSNASGEETGIAIARDVVFEEGGIRES